MLKRLLTSCLGLGFLPGAPGTFGSLPPVAVFAIMASLNASVTAISLTMAALVLVGSVVCVVCSPAVAASLGKEDPGEIVADELAGQAIVFIAIPTIAPSQIWLVAILGFILFRLFDILKPWPICRLEKLPKGWGILADDLMAGLLASIILQILVKLPIAG